MLYKEKKHKLLKFKTMSHYKTYKRKLRGFNAIQKLITIDNRFHRIENISNDGSITYGFCPNNFEVGVIVPYGFYSKFGFKQYKEGENESYFQSYESGNFT